MRYSTELLKSPYSVQIRENTDQKKTPYLDTFHTMRSLKKKAAKLTENTFYSEDVYGYWNGLILGVIEFISP